MCVPIQHRAAGCKSFCSSWYMTAVTCLTERLQSLAVAAQDFLNTRMCPILPLLQCQPGGPCHQPAGAAAAAEPAGGPEGLLLGCEDAWQHCYCQR